MKPPPVLDIVDLGKDFGAFRALDAVSLKVAPGSVHAVLGENGAGKSTLVKCVMGYHRADRGTIRLDDVDLRAGNPRQAQALGIGMVYQHFTLVDNLSVAENLVLARTDLPFLIDWRQQRLELARFMEHVPFPLALDALVRDLSAGEKQKLEILKQLYLGSRIVILDEPTSVLTPSEADEVLGHLRGMARRGRISVLMITHKFREVSAFADEVTVLRRGRVSGRGRASELVPAALAEMMVGSAPPRAERHDRAPVLRGEPRLRLERLSARDELGQPALREVSLSVRPGEIVGVAAVAGNGQEELVEVLAGQREASGGKLFVGEREYLPTRRNMRREGVRCLPEDPLRSAAVAGMSVADNLALHDFDQPPFLRLGCLLRRGLIAERARARIAEYGVRTRSPRTPIGQLSGGNVQRVVLARELGAGASVLVVANPCMGLDFRAVAEIHRRLHEARARGAAILLVSADLDEVLALADRVVVLSDGRIAHETPIAGADVLVIGRYMAGHAGQA